MPAPLESINRELKKFRNYLQVLAQLQLDPRLRGKVDLSGVIQQTLLEAFEDWEQLQHWRREQQAGWLRRAFAHNLIDEIRAIQGRGRDVRMERSLENALQQSSVRLEAWLQSEDSSPGKKAIRREEADLVATALAKLPDRERVALILQRWHQCKLDEIAQHLECTANAVAGLLHRGLERLRGELQKLGVNDEE